jgi:hypothetical protein
MKGGKQQKAEGILRRCRMFIKIKGKKNDKKGGNAPSSSCITAQE